MKGRTLVLAGTVMYLVAWFVPVEAHLDTLANGVLPGWQAFLVAVWPFGNGWSDPWYFRALYFASALSNVILIGAVALDLIARRRPARWFRWVLIALALLNTHWFLLFEDRRDLRIGYYLWAISFFVIAAGVVLEARASTSSEAPAL